MAQIAHLVVTDTPADIGAGLDAGVTLTVARAAR